MILIYEHLSQLSRSLSPVECTRHDRSGSLVPCKDCGDLALGDHRNQKAPLRVGLVFAVEWLGVHRYPIFERSFVRRAGEETFSGQKAVTFCIPLRKT